MFLPHPTDQSALSCVSRTDQVLTTSLQIDPIAIDNDLKKEIEAIKKKGKG